jgi:hypothetical protein
MFRRVLRQFRDELREIETRFGEFLVDIAEASAKS